MKLTKLQLRIKAENEAFEKLTPSEKRVSIARDVIAQLASKRFEAKQGLYVDTDAEVTKATAKRDASEVFASAKSCTVCGIGSLFVSAVCKADKLPVADLGLEAGDYADVGGDAAYAYLEQFFSLNQLKSIECAFEQTDSFGGDNSYQSAKFGDEVVDDDDRLRLIMENIIVNKGRFVPSQKPVQQWITPRFTG